MAYAIVASKWLEDKRYIEAVLDSASDLAALGDGYAPDSRAIVAEGGAAYMTDASGQWQELGSPGGGGGPSVTVEPLTVTQNGTTTAPSGKAYSPVTVAVPNPNSVVTVTGTADDPWGDIDYSTLAAALASNNASAKLVVDASQIGISDPIRLVGNISNAGYIFFEVIGSMSTNGITAASVNYDLTGALFNIFVAENSVVTPLNSYASLLTTTLTVIYHPLPTE